MTSATEELCHMLDERGMPVVDNMFGITWDYYSDPHTATESMDGTLIVSGLTPEQAIAATLGGGECRIVKIPSDSDFSDDWRYRCSECGCNIPVNERDPETGEVINAANYCPNCGRRVKR